MDLLPLSGLATTVAGRSDAGTNLTKSKVPAPAQHGGPAAYRIPTDAAPSCCPPDSNACATAASGAPKEPQPTMTTHYVTRVRKAPSPGKTHEHIETVCTSDNQSYSRDHVIRTINGRTDEWYTRSPSGATAKIEVITKCGRCDLKPYIRTVADTTTIDNLGSLPAC